MIKHVHFYAEFGMRAPFKNISLYIKTQYFFHFIWLLVKKTYTNVVDGFISSSISLKAHIRNLTGILQTF